MVWFALQWLTIIPLIEKAEAFESSPHTAHQHKREEWHPAEGAQRNSLTASATVLTGIAFSLILFGAISLLGRDIDAVRGAAWGLAGFICFNAAPAIGLPPQPPGVVLADISDRQVWWAATVIATAMGLWLVAGQRSPSWWVRVSGVVLAIVPHIVGAPAANGESVVPAELVHRFTAVCLFAAGLFWITLGVSGGFLLGRYPPRG
jgi:cobalt transporter subunit CbtA